MSLGRIILVEDNLAVLQHLQRNIEWSENGLEVAGAFSNGFEAIEALDPTLSLVITDIVMPRCTGIDVINAIAERRLDIESIVISAYDEFDYVHDAMSSGACEYLLKPVDERELLSKAREVVAARRARLDSRARVGEMLPLIADEILRAVVTGADRSRPIESDAELASLSITGRYGRCVVFELELGESHSESSMRAEYHAQFDLARSTIERILGELDVRLVTVADRRLVALVQCASNQLDSVNRRLDGLVELAVKSVRKATNLDVISATGPPRYAWQRYHESYYDAVRQLQNMFSGKSVSSTTVTYPSAIESRLLVAARDRNERAAVEAVDALCDEIRADGLPAVAARGLVGAVLVRLALDVARPADEYREFAEDVQRHLKDANTIEQLREATRRIVRAQMKSRSVIAREATDSLVLRLRGVVRERYTDPSLSVEAIADDVYLSANYVSRQFKLSTGQNLRDYLVQFRIEESMKLLRYSPLRVYEIAEKVGFRSQQYFATRFRERVGMTPGEYARLAE
jgi:two-component system response regulator YesN